MRGGIRTQSIRHLAQQTGLSKMGILFHFCPVATLMSSRYRIYSLPSALSPRYLLLLTSWHIICSHISSMMHSNSEYGDLGASHRATSRNHVEPCRHRGMVDALRQHLLRGLPLPGVLAG